MRLRKNWDTAGILVAHVGISLLLLSGFVTMYFSESGHVTLYQSQRSDTFQSYYRWEIAIAEPLSGEEAAAQDLDAVDGRYLREHIVAPAGFL